MASSFISLRHPLRRPRQRASVFCANRTPTLLEESGRWGTQRSELLGSDTNFAATPCVAPCGGAAGSANLGSDPKNSGDSRSAECPSGLILRPIHAWTSMRLIPIGADSHLGQQGHF